MCNIICQLEPDEEPTILHTYLCTADFLIFFHMQVTVVLRQLHDHPGVTEAVSRLFLSIAISKQLNAAPYIIYVGSVLFLAHQIWKDPVIAA